MQQRARVSMDALFRDLVMAGAGLQVPAIAPFRRGDNNPDLPGSAFADRISVRYVPPDAAAGGAVTITYALRADASGVPQLTRYDGRSTDLPVVDQIAGLRFEYFDAAGQPIPVERFADGPWVPDAVAADRFDADLQAIRRVRARGPRASGTHVRGRSARRPRSGHRRVAEEPESPMTLVIALMSLVLLSALGTSLAVVTNTELRAAANYAASRETMYAADGALQIAARELLSGRRLERAAVERRAVGVRGWSARRRPAVGRRDHGRFGAGDQCSRTASRARGARTIPCGGCLRLDGSGRGRTSWHGRRRFRRDRRRSLDRWRRRREPGCRDSRASRRSVRRRRRAQGARGHGSARRGAGRRTDRPDAVVAGNQVVKAGRQPADK